MEENDDKTMNYPIITKDYKAGAVILAAGDYPKNEIPLCILNNAEYVCCCDNAAVTYIKNGNIPDVIVGDCDSLPKEFKEKYSDKLKVEVEQEFNDLTKATRFCISKGYKDIVYIGATGKREDHTLGNISLIVWYMQEFGICPIMVTDYGYFVTAKGLNNFSSFKGQQVSIYNVDCKKINGKGFDWPTYAYQWLWQGTLNQATGNEFELDADGSYLVYRTFDAKDKL